MNEVSPRKTVVVGGGAGGLGVAAHLAELGLEVTLIEPSDTHHYQPFWTLVGGGIVPRQASARPMAEVMPKGCNWAKARVTAFDPEGNSVQTDDGQTIAYDYLVVAAGLQIDWGKIEGLPETLGKHGVCSNYSYDSVAYTWQCLQEFKGGTALFTFPPPPIKCAGAPQKIMYLADEYFRKKGIRDKTRIVYMCAAPSLFSVKKYSDALTEQCVKPRNIETRFRENLVAIRPESKEAAFKNLDSGEETVLKFDMLHAVPPMSAPDFIRSSPLANGDGWVDVNRETLQHVRYPNVFALGDCSGLPTSKTAAAIRAQRPVLVENLLKAMKSADPSARYDGYTACPLVTGYSKVILAEFDYNLNPKETFPFDQGKERFSMYLLKRFVFPYIYWKALIKGRRWPWQRHHKGELG